MIDTGAEGLSLDSVVDFPAVAASLPPEVVLIGNVDPVGVMRDGTPAAVRAAVTSLCDSMRRYPNYILSTGCDLPPDTPFENIAAFMETGRKCGGP
jgi:uroporphyrinogen-III decarboxylase